MPSILLKVTTWEVASNQVLFETWVEECAVIAIIAIIDIVVIIYVVKEPIITRD